MIHCTACRIQYFRASTVVAPITRSTYRDHYFPRLFDVVRQRLNAVLWSSLTSDAWTDRMMAKYLCVTAHWIDERWTQCHATIAMRPLHGSMTGERLFGELEDIAERTLPTDTYVMTMVPTMP
jgi:hypothetical protein